MKETLLYKNTIESLRECYDIHAEKFSSTRKKNRPELDYIAEKISEQQWDKKWISIIELWCWDWRLFGYIEKFYPNLIAHYTGVDISNNLLSIAKKNFSNSTKAQRIHDDMIHYLSTCKNESVDSIICIASFQHLPDKKSRDILLHNIYRVLVYNGSWSSIDWSWSTWMIQKHGKLLWESIKKKILSNRKRERNNLLIPFTHNWITKDRLYHIFTIFELKKLLSIHWFNQAFFMYSGQDWSFHHNIFKARNICTYVQKKVFYDM